MLAAATERLRAAGIASARVDAELLLASVVGVPRSRLPLAHPTADQAERFAGLVERRAARVPLQHLTGTAPFRHLELAVGPGVFVPRPETELLIDAVLPHLKHDSVAVDLGAGSGALALALAQEAPGTQVYAVETAPPALAWLQRNAAGTGVTVVAGDIHDDELLPELRGRVDVVVSNPPYVPAATAVEPEVGADPAEAVFAGPDGLALMPAVLARAAELLRPGGVVAVEHDETHGPRLVALARATRAFADVADHADLSGRPRFLTASRCGTHR